MGEKDGRFGSYRGGSDEWAMEQFLYPSRVPKRIGQKTPTSLKQIYSPLHSSSDDLGSQIRDTIDRAKEM